MRFKTVLVLAAAAAIVPSMDQAQSKWQRIRQYVNTGGGTLILTGELYDTALQVDCKLLRAIDGKIRCLPVTHNPEQDISYATMRLYADADCTRPLVHLQERFALIVESDFSQKYRVYDVGAPYTGTVYSDLESGPSGCTAVGTGQEHNAYTVTERSPEDFVVFTRGLY